MAKTRRRRPKKRVRVVKRNSAWSSSTAGRVLGLLGAFLLGYVVFLGAGLAWNALLSEIEERGYFELERVVITGTERTTRDEILKACGLEGFETRHINILRLDLGAIAEAVSNLPWVHAASAERSDIHELRISVEEEVPVAVVRFSDTSGLWLVNSEGKAFVRIDTEAKSLPLISGIDKDEFGAALVGESGSLQKALSVLKAWRSVGAKKTRLVELRIDNRGYVAVFERNRNRAEAILGSIGFEQKFVRLLKLWHVLEEQGETPEWFFLDNNRNPNWVTVRTRKLAENSGQ